MVKQYFEYLSCKKNSMGGAEDTYEYSYHAIVLYFFCKQL